MEKPEAKITMREARVEGIKRAAEWVAKAEDDLKDFFARSAADTRTLETTDFENNTSGRNAVLGRIILRDKAIEKLLAERRKNVEDLKKRLKSYTGKDVKMLKAQLGMDKPVDDEISTEISPEKRPMSAGEPE